ncbi:MAG: hypothetical protein V1875_05025 [Candidatus Altiarchaeota archaeon]
MDSTTYRVLYALSRRLDRGQSISELVRRIRELGYTAYYKNIYDKCQKLKDEGIIKIEKTGMTSLLYLRLTNPGTIDELASMELRGKKEFLEKNKGEEQLLRDIESIRDINLKATAIIRPEKNAKLNTAEILFLIDSDLAAEGLCRRIQEISKKNNLKVYSLILTEEEFKTMLQSEGYNQAKEILTDKVVLENQSGFWRIVSQTPPTSPAEEIEPRKISEQELYWNLERFGYTAFTKISSEKTADLNIETTIMACLLKDDARLTEAAAVLIGKNKINIRLLLYLGLKHNKLSMLGYLIDSVKELTQDDKKQTALSQGLIIFNVFYTQLKSNTTSGRWGIDTRTSAQDLLETLRKYDAA